MTGILDGDLSGGNPKAIELFVSGTEDLSSFVVQRSTNGAAFDAIIALSGTYTNSFVYLVSNAASFDSVFGSTGDFSNRIVSGNVSGNGNDAFRLMQGPTVIDQVAPVQNSPNTYIDGWLYRINGTGPDGGWVPANWTGGSVDGLDAAGHAAAVPFGTYAVPEPATLALSGLGGLLLMRRWKGWGIVQAD